MRLVLSAAVLGLLAGCSGERLTPVPDCPEQSRPLPEPDGGLGGTGKTEDPCGKAQ